MPVPRYRLEQLEVPETLAGFTIRRYEPGDESKILATFNRVFRASRTLEHWRWEFPGNPEGMQVMVAIHDATGEVAGHYAGVPRRIKCRDATGIACDSVDSMVDPRFRAGLRRPGLFVILGLRWFRDFGSGGNLFAHGLPNEAAVRVGGVFLTYQTVHSQLALERAVDGARPFGGSAPPAVSEVERFDGRVDALWERVAPEIPIGTIRDARYLNWRFAD